MCKVNIEDKKVEVESRNISVEEVLEFINSKCNADKNHVFGNYTAYGFMTSENKIEELVRIYQFGDSVKIEVTEVGRVFMGKI